MKAEIVRDTGAGSIFAQYVKRRIKRNKNFMMAITGPTGSGKTYSALRLGEQLDPDFDMRNVVFEPSEFMKLVNGKVKEIRSGSVIVYEEAGVTLGHRDWHSTANRLVHYVLQTFRHKNLIVIFTVPDFGFFDASARKLMHCRAETRGIDVERNRVILAPYMLSVSQSTGKMWNMFLRYTGSTATGGGSNTKLTRLEVGLPSPELLEAYEERKKAFTDRLNDRISRELGKEEEEAAPVSDDVRARLLPKLTARQLDVLERLEDGMSIRAVMDEMGYKSRHGFREKLRELKRKGFVLKRRGDGLDATYEVAVVENRGS